LKSQAEWKKAFYVLRAEYMEPVASALGASIEIHARMLRISMGEMRLRNKELKVHTPHLQPPQSVIKKISHAYSLCPRAAMPVFPEFPGPASILSVRNDSIAKLLDS
jgi:hypothetical protein